MITFHQLIQWLAARLSGEFRNRYGLEPENVRRSEPRNRNDLETIYSFVDSLQFDIRNAQPIDSSSLG